ncbi:MAG: DNA-3-methyladenine glycosylase 2 family protein, partial [Acidobacteria bacterium]|nr:DNA-3-methyladenine glycosylase 2 family protein [Acidobacteriota bacterium]
MDFWQRYRIVETRDQRFDGQFFTAVRTTGIYCRPSCPARTPKPTNLTFYPTSAAAHDAGYRACKRCLPEASPGSPEWNLRSDAAGRAMRLIADGEVERTGVNGLAATLGYSPRQLNRILLHELGAGPQALARASRAQTARTLLTATDMKLADVAFAAGFGSIRAFNETILSVFDLTPTALRGTSRQHQPASAAASLTLKLPFREPFETGIFDFLAARAVAGVESVSTGLWPKTYSRAMALPEGHACFSVEWDGQKLLLQATVEDVRSLPAVLSRVRRLFDLDADPVGIDAALSADSRLAGRVSALPGVRLPGALDAGEILLRAMIGQQITVAAATTALNSLAGVGTASRIPTKALYRHFPTPAQIADGGRSILRGPAKRIEAICNAAALLADGSLHISVADDVPSLSAKLLPLPGIGPWTVGYVAMRVLGAPDVFLPTDIAVRNGIKAITGVLTVPTAKEAERFAAPLRPWRSYLTMHLWRAALKAPISASSALL